MHPKTLLKIACVSPALALAVLTGCGQAEPKSVAQIALEESETTLVGRALFTQIKPKTLSPEQRRILVRLLGGEWLGNGFFIPAERVEADCRVGLIQRETCRARPSRPESTAGIGGPPPNQEPIGGIPLR